MSRLFSNAEFAAIGGGLAVAILLLLARSTTSLPLFAAAFAMLMMVLWITLSDVSRFIIPDGPLVCLALLGAASRLAGHGDNWWPELIEIGVDAALCGGALFLLREAYYRLRGYDGIGFGDVKLAAVGAVMIGPADFTWAMLASSSAGLLLALLSSARKPPAKLDRLPFGALLAPAFWWFWVSANLVTW